MEKYLHRFRQVHLDFHTALEVDMVGDFYDPKTFVETLQTGHVDTINIFAKCHHGYSYYPTKVGTMHPKLKFDLLGSMIEPLHQANIRCPIYVSVKWDDLAAIQHPEWVCVDRDGKMHMREVLSGEWGWSTMDISSAYADFFVAQLEELIGIYGKEIDGWWFDICSPFPNYSPRGMAQMRKAGVNLEDDSAVWCYARQQDLAFFNRITQISQQKIPHASIYYNGTSTADMGEVKPYMTHFEVESLPTSGDAWGYMHYPVMARQARSYGKELIGMTGRFHRSWADFGGLKTQDQLDYECGTILSAGGRICVGDQLHPNGALDPAVYRLIGKSFGKIEALEPWLYGAQPMAEAALLTNCKAGVTNGIGSLNRDVEGAAQMLLEAGIQFDIADESVDLDKYAVLFVPDGTQLPPAWQEKLSAYMAQGGKLVVSGTGALDTTTGQFQLDQIPVKYRGAAPTQPSYLRPDYAMLGESELAADYDYVFYDQAHLVSADPESLCYGEIKRAMFNRTWEHFTSHRHAPVGESLHAPIAVQKENVLYFAAPLFSGYHTWDYWAYRAMAIKLLRDFLPPALVKTNAPGWVEVTLHQQSKTDNKPERKIVHIVAYHARRSSQSIPHVDQGWTTNCLTLKVKWDGAPPNQVYLAPQMQNISFLMEDGYVCVELPPVGVYSVIAFE
jgi:hypothetical protein